MFNQMMVQEALKHICKPGKDPGFTNDLLIVGQDSEISLLIHDIFGGEILKTHKKNGWHFYNRIDGKIIDFTNLNMNRSFSDSPFENIPATSDETHNYFATEDYSTFFMKFVRAFEEAVGLNRKLSECAA